MSKRVEQAAVAAVALAAADQSKGGPDNLYMTVDTIDTAGKRVGDRIVDLKHYGTRNWLANHLWWAMHQGHLVEVCPATPQQVEEYLAIKAKELQDKFASDEQAAA